MYFDPMKKILRVVCRRMGCPVSRVRCRRREVREKRDFWCRAMFVRAGVAAGYPRYELAWFLDLEDRMGSVLYCRSERLWQNEPVFRDVYRQCLDVLQNELPERYGKA